MRKRFVSIWFRHLKTDWFLRKSPENRDAAFVTVKPHHGKMIITAVNERAAVKGIHENMALADAKAICPGLVYLDDKPEINEKLLTRLAEWMIRYTPSAGIDLPDGILLDATGCAHLWGGEAEYITDIRKRLSEFGYKVSIAITDSIGASWAAARFSGAETVVGPGKNTELMRGMPPAAFRLEPAVVERLEKLGLNPASHFLSMPRSAIRRRFGAGMIVRIGQALGTEEEWVVPVIPRSAFRERLCCMDPIVNRHGVEIALKQLLETICIALRKEDKGLRESVFTYYRLDHVKGSISINTGRGSSNHIHLFKLFESKIDQVEPAEGIELFVLEATIVEDVSPNQEELWQTGKGIEGQELAELIDRISARIGAGKVHRYVPAEHYWPERSFKESFEKKEKEPVEWKVDRPRPLKLLKYPKTIEVAAPIPDYPPMLFRMNGKVHKLIKADGPERIEQEWWISEGEHRDYYSVEDEEGKRYWIYRAGHYDAAKNYQWFLHGFFA